MTAAILTRLSPDARLGAMRWRLMLTAAASALLAGCVQVSAPEKPIEINLNISIKQEVVVQLRQEARELIESNPGVF